MVEPHLFIFLGSDEREKQKRQELLSKKMFPPDLKDLNYTVLYGDEKQLKPAELKEALTCLPTEGVKKRLVVIKTANKLSKAHQEILIQEAGAVHSRTIVILDIPETKGSEAFVSEFSKLGAEVVRFKSESASNVFDLGRAILARQPETALIILSELLLSREKAEKILGAIFWQWERLYADKRLTENVYKRGLKLLLDSDKKLKSSSSVFARENLILEALVVKLSYLA